MSAEKYHDPTDNVTAVLFESCTGYYSVALRDEDSGLNAGVRRFPDYDSAQKYALSLV